MPNNLDIWDKVRQAPKYALREIQGGRLKGMSDVNPQWRYKAMTEQFGVCGIGWKYEIVRVFSEPADEGQVFAFAEVKLFIKLGEWSDPIPGYGGSMLVEKEKAGLHANDEGYKMAITDALSTAMKMLGVAADVYAGLWDGTKYRDSSEGLEETKEHWCSIHKTPFFKKGKMKAYAHPIKDESGITSGWCNEEEGRLDESLPEAAGIVEEPATPESSTEPSTPTGTKVQNITEFKKLLMNHKIGTREAWEILNINSFMELTDLDKAWAKIKKAKGIE